MTYFLTSSPTVGRGGPLNPANGFVEALRAAVTPDRPALFITSEPDDPRFTEAVAAGMRRALEDAGLRFSVFDALDARNAAQAEALVTHAGLIILSGGHTPTENRFFNALRLRELLRGWDGVLIGISAGTMNCAQTVYAHPELEGESVDPAYQRFLPGLGLTKKMILPHYNEMREETLDGKRVLEDIAFPDSFGREFFALPDGSYLYIAEGTEEFRGEVHRIADGKMERIQ